MSNEINGNTEKYNLTRRDVIRFLGYGIAGSVLTYSTYLISKIFGINIDLAELMDQNYYREKPITSDELMSSLRHEFPIGVGATQTELHETIETEALNTCLEWGVDGSDPLRMHDTNYAIYYKSGEFIPPTQKQLLVAHKFIQDRHIISGIFSFLEDKKPPDKVKMYILNRAVPEFDSGDFLFTRDGTYTTPSFTEGKFASVVNLGGAEQMRMSPETLFWTEFAQSYSGSSFSDVGLLNLIPAVDEATATKHIRQENFANEFGRAMAAATQGLNYEEYVYKSFIGKRFDGTEVEISPYLQSDYNTLVNLLAE